MGADLPWPVGSQSAAKRDDSGASATEYGLLIVGIAALIALVVFTFGDNVGGLFERTCDEFASQGAGNAC